jgi:hypothetical protein
MLCACTLKGASTQVKHYLSMKSLLHRLWMRQHSRLHLGLTEMLWKVLKELSLRIFSETNMKCKNNHTVFHYQAAIT